MKTLLIVILLLLLCCFIAGIAVWMLKPTESPLSEPKAAATNSQTDYACAVIYTEVVDQLKDRTEEGEHGKVDTTTYLLGPRSLILEANPLAAEPSFKARHGFGYALLSVWLRREF